MNNLSSKKKKRRSTHETQSPGQTQSRDHKMPPPPSHLTTALGKASLPQFFLPSTSCSPFHKKLQGLLKVNQFEVRQQALEQTQTGQRFWNYQIMNLRQPQ